MRWDLGAATVDVAYTGVESAIKVVDQIKSKLVAARQPGVDRGKIQSEITELQAQLRGVAKSASFSAENWLVGRLRRRILQCRQDHRVVVLAHRWSDRHRHHLDRSCHGSKLFDADDQSGILDTTSTTTNGGT